MTNPESCPNCGHMFYPAGYHGKDCGCGYKLSEHITQCWGRDGKSPSAENRLLSMCQHEKEIPAELLAEVRTHGLYSEKRIQLVLTRAKTAAA